MNSPYAAPHTPIASAKRPRIASRSAKMPPPAASSDPARSTPKTAGGKNDDKAKKSSYSSNSGKAAMSSAGAGHVDESSGSMDQNTNLPNNRKEIGVPSPTPSKNLFSPSLRPEHHPHHHHHSRSRSHSEGSGEEKGIYLATITATSCDNSADGSPMADSATATGSRPASHSSVVDSGATSAVGAAGTAEAVGVGKTVTGEVDDIAAADHGFRDDGDDDNDADSVSDDGEDEEEEDGEEFNPYLFIAGLPAHASVCILDKICLPPVPRQNSRPLPTLALDLDETLVHCTVEPIAKPDLVFPVTFNGTVYQVYVRKRPYLDYFLEAVSSFFEIVVFTASQKVYADVLLDKLDPGRKFIQHRLFREACMLVQGNYVKDLHVLGRDLKRSILVDNSPHAYSYQIDNGIPIESWYDDERDTELLKLIGFLKRIHGAEDYRPIVREHFKTYQLIENARMGVSISLAAPPF